MKTLLALMTGHTVRFKRHQIGNGMVLVCPHGGDRRAYAVHLSDGDILSGPDMIGRRRAAGLLSRARRNSA